MIRTLVGVLGAISALFSDKIVGIFEKLAIANPSEGTVRGWVRPAIRSEGVLIAAISLLNGRAYAWLMNLTGAFGAVVLLFPDLYQIFATAFTYERPSKSGRGYVQCKVSTHGELHGIKSGPLYTDA